jgi:hypothetical protein
LLSLVRFKANDDAVEFILRRTSVALVAFANKAEPPKSDTCEVNRLNWSQEAVNCSGV